MPIRLLRAAWVQLAFVPLASLALAQTQPAQPPAAPPQPPAAPAQPAQPAQPPAPVQPAQPAQPPAPAQPAQPATSPPPFATTKVPNTENVYIFRYGGYQAMFVVTPAGVIATDPIGYLRPQAVTTYIDEIRKVTKAPIKYVIYSHHHYDHIAGGKPFKAEKAVFVAHRRAKDHLARLKNPDVVIPDVVVDNKHVIRLGGTVLELHYVGRNHSDNSLVMLLPKEKILFTVDFIPIETVHFRNMLDGWVPEWEDSLKRVLALNWERMIPGHPYAGGRLGTKQDVQNLLQYMADLSAATKEAAAQGKCWDTAIKEIKLPKYEKWGAYNQFFAGNVERYCSYWGRGY
jgi:glyoxylase-like metal-dependent hydrolase (beta-lactamase superfamily II)